MGKFRFMRVIVMFDILVNTSEEKRDYRVFRKWLIKDGFIMMQYSIYSKLVLNESSAKLLRKRIEEQKTKKGLIQVLQLTENQFQDIYCIQGKSKTDIINTTDRVVFL